MKINNEKKINSIEICRLKKNTLFTIFNHLSYHKITRLRYIKSKRIFNYYLKRRCVLEQLYLNCKDCVIADREHNVNSDSEDNISSVLEIDKSI